MSYQTLQKFKPYILTDFPDMSETATTYCNGKTDAPADAETIDPGPENPDGYCGRPAGWGTSHVGEGRCKLHGGANDDGGRPPTHGLYSGRRDELQERFEQAFGDDKMGSMRAEIAVLRTLLSEMWERIEEVDEDTIEAATKLQGEIRKSLDTASKIEKRHAVTDEEIEALVTGMANLIESYVPESEQADALDELERIAGADKPRALEGGRTDA